MRRFRRALLTAAATVLVLALTATGAVAAFNAITSNPGNDFGTQADFDKPQVQAATIQMDPVAGKPGNVRNPSNYYVYADIVNDDGTPAAETAIASVLADVSTLTAAQSAASMTAGSYTVGTTTYNYRAGPFAVDGGVTEGSKAYEIAATDSATPSANSGTDSFTVSVDNTMPAAATSIIAKPGDEAEDGTANDLRAGYIRRGNSGGRYHVYANVADVGPAGIDTVTAGVTSVTSGQSAVALTSSGGPWTVDGVSYELRSAELTPNANLAEGNKAYTITSTDNAANVRSAQTGFSVNVDNTAPGASGVILKGEGGKASFIRQGSLTYGARASSYRISANATDTGTTPAGVQSIEADVANVTTGETAVALPADAHTADGTTYALRSASLTPNTTLAEGSKTWTLKPTDGAGNAPATPPAGTAVTVDNVSPIPDAIATTSGGGASAGVPAANDTLQITTVKQGAPTTGDPLDPDTIVAGWTAAASFSGTATMTGAESLTFKDDKNTAPTADDVLSSLGPVTNSKDYVDGDLTFGPPGSAARSTLALNFTSGLLTMTLGTRTGTPRTATAATSTLTWTPGTGLWDRAGNPLAGLTGGTYTETGTADRDW